MKRLLYRWPQKLAALLLAVLVWYFVSTDDTNITQRRLELPLQVEGLAPNQVAVGVPDAVEVIVSGPGPRIDTLRPENFSAVLDLSDTSGDFDKQVSINVLQGISLLQTRPSTVIGTVETKERKQVPVDVLLLGKSPPGQKAQITSKPAEATVTGIRDALAKVTAVAAPVPAKEGDSSAPLYAIDAQGRPVGSVTVEPTNATITISLQAVLWVRELPVMVQLPQLAGYAVESATPSKASVRIAGPLATLNALQNVPVTVEFDTRKPAEGSYTLEAEPQLPDGLVALEPLTVTLQLRRSAPGE